MVRVDSIVAGGVGTLQWHIALPLSATSIKGLGLGLAKPLDDVLLQRRAKAPLPPASLPPFSPAGQHLSLHSEQEFKPRQLLHSSRHPHGALAQTIINLRQVRQWLRPRPASFLACVASWMPPWDGGSKVCCTGEATSGRAHDDHELLPPTHAGAEVRSLPRAAVPACSLPA